MKGALKSVVIVFFLLLSVSCATTSKEAGQREAALTVMDISEGLPREGLWRQKIALVDMNGDGFLDIVTPPPRGAAADKNRPHVFLWSRQDAKWKEGPFIFPPDLGYNYGGIAVGDLNRDGYPDLVLAGHAGAIILLENDKKNGFVQRPFSAKTPFYSRAVELADVNGDGWPDVIAFSEGPFVQDYKAGGILIGINRAGKDWEVKTIESPMLSGDAMAVGDLNGDGNKDIVVAPLTGVKEYIKPIWFGDGLSNFRSYEGDLVGDKVTQSVRTGDIDGDGKDEIVFRLSGIGAGAKDELVALKWTGESFVNISEGLQAVKPIVFDLADPSGDGKRDLVVLTEKGIALYKYSSAAWVNIGFQELAPADTKGAFDLRAGRNSDGSLLVVYNLGYKEPTLNNGIRAFRIRLDGGRKD